MGNRVGEEARTLTAAAAGRERADLVLHNASVLDVFTGTVRKGSLAVKDGVILGLGPYKGKEERDLKGAYVLPGFIDGHVHIESSLCTPGEFARAVVPRGTTCVIADPHEIANVLGMRGITFMMRNGENLPLDIHFMLPSCVPATEFEDSGAVLDAAALEELMDHPAVLGLGEVMDYPGVVEGRPDIFRKITLALSRNKRVDGHGPGITGLELNAYCGAGITTEHECSTREEMEERLSRGMHILIREGSAARNLETLVGGVNPRNSRRCLFCTDDKQPADILSEGHIDYNIRRSVALGLDPVTAVQMATLNAAECYGLRDRGAVAPGYRADLVVVDDLTAFRVREVYKDGIMAARNGEALFSVPPAADDAVKNTVHLSPLSPSRFALNLSGPAAHVMVLNGHSLVTGKAVRSVQPSSQGLFVPRPGEDLLKLAVIERHGKTGQLSLALVENYRLQGGAAATTIAHDSHNLIVIGDNDSDMAAAANALIEAGGGMVLVREGRVLEILPLPVAGLMSDEPVEEIREKARSINEKAWGLLGVNRELDPFMTLAFLSLPVIPELKLTARGLFDVTAFQFVPLCPEDR